MHVLETHEINIKEFDSTFDFNSLPDLLFLNIHDVMFNVYKEDCKVVLKGTKKYLSIPSPMGNKTILLPLSLKDYKLSNLEVLKLMQGYGVKIRGNIFVFHPLRVYDEQKRKEIGALTWSLNSD